MVEPQDAEAALFPERVGDRLRVARMKAGLDLSDIATKTRVPVRHLQAIEAGDYSSFPSPTYCVGFVKAYARAIGQDEVGLAHDLRAELGEVKHDPRHDYYDAEDADPARLPTRTLAWTAAAIALVFAIAYGIWRTQLMSPNETRPPAVVATSGTPASPQPATTPAQPSSTGQVALTAREPVWVRIYDAEDKVLFEKEMAAGEVYRVPLGARDPQIRTGRADLITVTIDGREVPALGPANRTIKDIGVSAASLVARAAAPATPQPSAAPAATPVAPRP